MKHEPDLQRVGSDVTAGLGDDAQSARETPIDNINKSDTNFYDHDAECEEALHAELRKLRSISTTLHRQRNELLQQMRLILAATQNWNGGWVGKGQSAEDVITYIAQMAGNALAEVGRNGQ